MDLIKKDVREMCRFVEQYAIRAGGIQSDEYIDDIKCYIKNKLLRKAFNTF